jgi:nucleoside-diphosphate-sugar epimerase
MKCLVTGAAGFIGSHLCEKLLEAGHEVWGIDAFIPYYAEHVKRDNLSQAVRSKHFHFQELDLRREPLEGAVRDVETIYHLAAMPGLMKSWADFDGYSTCNLQATQRLLEAVKQSSRGLRLLLQISTSSVYGRHASGDESLPTRPVSPYGVTKLAAEHLCQAYAENYGIPLVILRYFSVYGPRQRPDMAYHLFIDALLRRQPITIYGDGTQVRGNTYIDDCVAATLAASEAKPGEIYNVGGGEIASILEIVRKLEAISGLRAVLQHGPSRPGDQQRTFADTAKLRSDFGWEPCTSLNEGLARQWEWQKSQFRKEAKAA